MITGFQLFHFVVTMKMHYLNLRIVDIITNVNKKRVLFSHLQGVNRGQSWTKSVNFGYVLRSKKFDFKKILYVAVAEL